MNENNNKMIKNISEKDVGKSFRLMVKIESIYQTSGPTVFSLNDGTGRIRATAFNNGKRAYPNFNVGDFIYVFGNVKKRNNVIELEIIKGGLLNDGQTSEVKERIDKHVSKKIMPVVDSFLVESDVLEKLKQKFVDATKLIKAAIYDNRPIIIRHHNDCDGYSSAIALERAIYPMIVDVQGDSAWKYYRRAPSATPFYNYDDVTKDLGLMLNAMAKFGLKESLIIVVDNGSTQEDLMAIKKAKIYNCQIVVVDHHFPGKIENGKSLIDGFVDVHINPYLVGGNSNLSAGMLSTELARFINGGCDNINYIAALAGVGDRVSGPEFNQYLKIAEGLGYSLDYLKELAEVIDFESRSLRNMESHVLVDDIFGRSKDKQKQLVELIIQDVNAKKENRMKNLIHFSEIEEDGDEVIATVNLKDSTEMGYPSMGKSTGMLFDYLKNKYNEKSIFVIGYSDSMTVIRISDDVKININFIIDLLNEKYDYASIEGGGHERAGSIRFVPAMRNIIIKEIVNYFKEGHLCSGECRG